MSRWPKDIFAEELKALAALDYLFLERTEPLDHLAAFCPTLVKSTPSILERLSHDSEDKAAGMRQLLRHVAFSAKRIELRAAGDLLGLSNAGPGSLEDLPIDEVRTIFDAYGGKDKPASFIRFGREVRKVLAVRHFGYGITWLGLHGGRREAEYFEMFVDELCELLDNQGGNLTRLERSLGLLPEEPASIVELFDLSPNPQAKQLERTLALIEDSFPEVSASDRYRLAVLLNFNPILTKKICEYLHRSPADVPTACRILSTDPSALLDALALRNKETTPTKWLREIATTLSTESPDCLQLFDFLSCVHHEKASSEYLMAFLLQCRVTDHSRIDHGLMLLHRATSPLEDLGLVHPSYAYVYTNPLVQRIWRRLRRQEVRALLETSRHWVLDADTERSEEVGSELYAAGWNPATWASRKLCSSILYSIFYDQFHDEVAGEKSGRFGAEWLLATDALWERYLRIGASAWAIRLIRTILEQREDGETDESCQIDLTSDRTKFQVREFLNSFREERAMRTLQEIATQTSAAFGDVLDSADLPPEGTPERASTLHDLAIDKWTVIHGDPAAEVATDLGNISFASVIPGW